MKRRPFVPALALVAGCLAVSASETTAPAWGGDPIAPITAPFPMPVLERPAFPAHVENIVAHGAVAGGEVKNTAAFARAIAACSDAGGGRVLVPAGRWLTGPIHLRSNIELHLAAGAEVVFSDRFEDYLPPVLVRVGGIELYNYSPLVYARDCTNIAITGPGRLNGNAQAWWPWKTKETKEIFALAPRGIPVEQRVFGTPEAAIRPSFVVFFNCRNILLEGFTIGSGPNWTIHPIYSENIIIRRVQVRTDGPNNDGIDPDSCRNVLIEHCLFDTGDDCVVLKSGYNEDGRRVARPTENVVMRWCTSERGHGGMVIGSEMSGDVRNVYVHDCDFTGTDRALRIKSRADRGGVVEKVWAENLRLRNMQYEAVILNMDYSADRSQLAAGPAPVFRDIHVRNLVCDGAPAAVRIVGLESSPIHNLTFTNLAIRSEAGVLARHVADLRFESCVITPAAGPAFQFEHARSVRLRDSAGISAGAAFLQISGADSADIVLENCDLGTAAEPIRSAPEVPPDAVTTK